MQMLLMIFVAELIPLHCVDLIMTIRILPNLDTCADCIYRSFNKSAKKLWCTKHNTSLPNPYFSKRKSLYQMTCDDVLTASVNLEIETKKNTEHTINSSGQTFEEWWEDVLYLFDTNNYSHFLNKKDPDFYKEYFLDNDSPDIVYELITKG